MSDAAKLTLIKLAHTIIWGVEVCAILYVCYAGLFNKIGILTWVCVGMVLGEGVVLLANKWSCPLTSVARKYTIDHSIGFDIFIPKWLAKNNKLLFSALFLAGCLLVLWRVVWFRE